MQQVDVAIIGAGSAGLSAFREVRKATDNVVLIDQGPFGTTCARVGCMPSKALIEIANQFHQRKLFSLQGIQGGDHLHVDIPAVLARVRELRDYFVGGVLKGLDEIKDYVIQGRATFVDPQQLLIDDKTPIKAEKIIVCTGSTAKVPSQWKKYQTQLLTSDKVFAVEGLPASLAVIGTGVIGLELGQALARLGISVTAYGRSGTIGGLTDPEINKVAIAAIEQDMPFVLNEAVSLNKPAASSGLEVKVKRGAKNVDNVLVAIGRSPNLAALNLEAAKIKFNKDGTINHDPRTMQVGNSSIFIAGDVNGKRPLLHEAADEGRIAGYNAVHGSSGFHRRTPLYIVFTSPNIAIAGCRYKTLCSQQIEFVTGSVSFEDQGRSRIKGENQGRLHVYVSKKDGLLLGAEMVAPSGEHLAHLLAWGIEKKLSVFDALQMPFYHPTIEEGLRTAFRDAATKLENSPSAIELAMCESSAAKGLD